MGPRSRRSGRPIPTARVGSAPSLPDCSSSTTWPPTARPRWRASISTFRHESRDGHVVHVRGTRTRLPVVDRSTSTGGEQLNHRTNALADRLEQGASALATFASALTDTEWQTRVPKDGRKIGVVVHHVASMYPLEIQLAQTLAGGKPVAGVTWDDVHAMNAAHAKEHDAVTKEVALGLLRRNSAAAAGAIRA